MSNIPDEKTHYRNIKGRILIEDNKIYVVSEFGHKISVKPILNFLQIDPFTKFTPPFDKIGSLRWDTELLYDDVKTNDIEKSREEIQEILKNRDIMPPNFDYEFFHIGFVYGLKNSQDPNNHKWWLHFFNKNNQGFSSVFCKSLDIDVSVNTVSWADSSNNFYHGRFKVMKKDVKIITEIEKGYIKIIGNKPNKNKKGVSENEKMIFTFDVRKNIWNVKRLDTISNFKNIVIGQYEMKGIADRSFEKPIVSFELELKRVKSLDAIGDTLIIK